MDSHTPFFVKIRQFSEQKLQPAQAEFKKFQNSEIISPLESEWMSHSIWYQNQTAHIKFVVISEFYIALL